MRQYPAINSPGAGVGRTFFFSESDEAKTPGLVCIFVGHDFAIFNVAKSSKIVPHIRDACGPQQIPHKDFAWVKLVFVDAVLETSPCRCYEARRLVTRVEFGMRLRVLEFLCHLYLEARTRPINPGRYRWGRLCGGAALLQVACRRQPFACLVLWLARFRHSRRFSGR